MSNQNLIIIPLKEGHYSEELEEEQQACVLRQHRCHVAVFALKYIAFTKRD